MKTFQSHGVVIGNLWGGGRGGYGARPFNAKSRTELLRLNLEALENGSLDSGMGYESLIGACITVTTVHTKTINGKEFINKEYEDVFVEHPDRPLTEEEKELLESWRFDD